MDIRRLTLRIVASDFARMLPVLAQAQGGDVFRYLVFTTIWTANSQHLTSPDRYAELYDIPPDAQRRPAPEALIREMLGAPREVVDPYIEQMVAEGTVERVAGGLLVPSAVFTQPDQLANANEFYARFVAMIARLRESGFSFGE